MTINVNIPCLFAAGIFIIIALLGLIYSIPIICFRRFHEPNNMFTLNVCVSMILLAFSWIPIYIAEGIGSSYEVLEEIDLVTDIPQYAFTIQLPYSLVVISIYRYFFVVYHRKNFFKRKGWIILCIASQWILGFVLIIPIALALFNIIPYSCSWFSIYELVIMVIIPSITFLIVNILIYRHVRSSTRRIQPEFSHTTSNGIQQAPKFTRRDLVLIRHMVIMYCIFVGGWGPIYASLVASCYIPVSFTTNTVLIIWVEVTGTMNVIDLFWYNRDLRNFFKDLCLRPFRR